MQLATDWRYNEDRLDLRSQCLSILLHAYGSSLNEQGAPLHSSESIYNCAHDWVSHGHRSTDGIIKNYETYYG